MTDLESPLFTCPPFPPISIEGDSGYWEGDITLGERRLSVSFYVDAAALQPAAQAVAAGRLVSRLVELEQRARDAIIAAATRPDDPASELVGAYLAFHRDELPEERAALLPSGELTAALRLVGLGLWSHESLGFVLAVDFSFGRAVSDELLVAKFGPDGELRGLSHES